MAKRYDNKTKLKVVSFIRDYNTRNGRGGQSAAAKKFNINPITLRKWLEQSGELKTARTERRRKLHSRKRAIPGSNIGILKRMAAIQDQLATLQAEYDQLKLML
ncbi:MAG: hypothetical protein MI807_11230 [Verrucomicrobiales bacterium]|nr:hypothetical protein [Verrucomicrobiales bacterium]